MSVTDTSNGAHSRLLEEFPPHTYAMWREAAESLLKGASFEKQLITPTYEGFDLQPIYNASDVESIPHLGDAYPGVGSRLRGRAAAGYRSHPWLISQELSAPTPDALNGIALHELQNGQNELNLWLDASSRAGLDSDSNKSSGVGVCGVSVSTLGDFEKLFAGIELPAISTYLRAGVAGEAIGALFFAMAEKKGVSPEKLKGCLEIDPLAYLVENGSLPRSLSDALDGCAAVTKFAIEKGSPLQTVCVQGHPYHNGGASTVQELATSLSTLVYYMKELTERGLRVAEIVPHLRLSLSIGSQYFIEVAKFRAARLLWSRIAEALELPDEARGLHLHARTGLWNKTRRDPYVNTLRSTTEAFSAVVGGVDSLHISAFDEIIREPDNFSRRIARNVHHILAEECDLTQVIDPAGGSWAVEVLTDQIATKSWEQFQKIEASGGILEALKTGVVQSAVAGTLACKRQSLAKRKDTLVGTNNYPNVNEKALEPLSLDYRAIADGRMRTLAEWREKREDEAVLKSLAALGKKKDFAALVGAAAAGATLGELHAAWCRDHIVTKITPIPLSRGSAPYEELADRVASLGKAAELLQLNFGPSRRYRLRADWTSAFFRVAGFPVSAELDFNGISEAVAALKSAPGKVALIVSDDTTYADHLIELATALKAARSEAFLVLAGAPGENEDAWRAAGIDDFVHVRVNNYDFNTALAGRIEG